MQGLNHADLLTIAKAGDPLVQNVAYFPDGKRIAVAGANPFMHKKTGVVRIFDTHGQQIWQHDFSISVWDMSLSPDDRHIVCSTGTNTSPWSGEIVMLNAENGEVVRQFEVPHDNSPRRVAFSSDGRNIAAACIDGSVRIWQTEDDRQSRRLPSSKEAEIPAYSSDGKWLVVGCTNGIEIWDAAGNTLKGSVPDSGTYVAISPDNRLLASCDGPSARIYDLNQLTTHPEAGSIPLKQLVGVHDGRILAMSFSPDSQTLATAGSDGTTRTWDVASGAELAIYRGLTGRASAVSFHPNGRVLATGGHQPGDVKFWDITRPTEQSVFSEYARIGRDIDVIAFSEDDRKLTVMSKGGQRLVWEVLSVQFTDQPTHRTHDEWLVPATLAVISEDAKWQADVGDKDNKTVRVWALSDQREIASIPCKFPVTDVAIAVRCGAWFGVFSCRPTALTQLKPPSHGRLI